MKNKNRNFAFYYKKTLICFLLPFLMSWVAAPRCFYNLEMTFFDREIVMQAMNAYTLSGIYQSQWSLVYVDLMREQSAIPQLIKENARRMKPNPLDYPFQSDKAEELLLKTLYEVFAKVIRKHSVANDETIQGMFKFIIEKQSKKLEACFGKKDRLKETK